jgi:hypothetical protein
MTHTSAMPCSTVMTHASISDEGDDISICDGSSIIDTFSFSDDSSVHQWLSSVCDAVSIIYDSSISDAYSNNENFPLVLTYPSVMASILVITHLLWLVHHQ